MNFTNVLKNECPWFEVFRGEESALSIGWMGEYGDWGDFDDRARSFGCIGWYGGNILGSFRSDDMWSEVRLWEYAGAVK